MNALLNALAAGFICGGGLFILTVTLVVKGGPVVGPHLALLGQFFPGYQVTVGGAFLGLAYGFAAGFVLAWSASVLYNRLAGRRRGGV
jgi:hypothetical protein